MYYNVVVKDTIDEDMNSNELTFTFYDLNEALSFAEKILEESFYHIEILQFEDEEN